MTDNLAGRIKRLVSGSINAIVDAAESSAPETVMTEAIREVEKATSDVRHELGKVLANKHHATRRLTETTSKHEALSEKLELAVKEGRDDLAEAAIARQLDLEAQLPVLEGALRDFAERETELEGYIAALNGRKREMEEDLAHFKASRSSAASGGAEGAPAAVAGNNALGKVEKAGTAFNRVLKNATGIAGTDAADTETARKLAELDQVARGNRIRERLAAVKAASGE
jgi:phage shock protein A